MSIASSRQSAISGGWGDISSSETRAVCQVKRRRSTRGAHVYFCFLALHGAWEPRAWTWTWTHCTAVRRHRVSAGRGSAFHAREQVRTSWVSHRTNRNHPPRKRRRRIRNTRDPKAPRLSVQPEGFSRRRGVASKKKKKAENDSWTERFCDWLHRLQGW